MAAEYQKAISDEQFDLIVLEVYEYVKSGKLSKMRVKGVARELVTRRDEDGELIFYDARCKGERIPVVEATMYDRVKSIVVNWRKYIAPLMETLLIEATYQQALKAKDNPTSFKTAAEMIVPKDSGADEDKPALPPRVVAILQQAPVGTTIVIGAHNDAQGTGDTGHERPDTVHSLADGQRQDTTIETIPSGHDKSVHGVHEGDDTAQGSAVPDTPVPLENAVDNDSRGSVGVA